MHTSHRVDIPCDFPLEELPRVCVVTGRDDATPHSVTLTVERTRGSQAGEAAVFGAGLAVGLLTGGFVLRAQGARELQLNLPYSPEAAARERSEGGLVAGLAAACMLAVLIGGAILLMQAGFRPRTSSWWYLIPGSIVAASGLAFLRVAMGGQPVVRCVGASAAGIALELPSQAAAEAIRRSVLARSAPPAAPPRPRMRLVAPPRKPRSAA